MNWWKKLYLRITITQAQPLPELIVCRHPRWSGVRADYLYIFPFCAVCETKLELEVHHILPVQFFPEYELMWGNLLTLCRPHHFAFGHLLDWKAWNPDVLRDVQIWNRKIKNRKLTA